MAILLALLRKELLQLGRDKVILRMLFLIPIVQLVVLANAATFELRDARLWVVDHDHSVASRAVIDGFRGSGRFVTAGTSENVAAADHALTTGSADAAVVIPDGFERSLSEQGAATIQLLLDAVNGSQAGIIAGYSRQIVANTAPRLATTIEVAAISPTRQVLPIRSRSWYNPGANYTHFMVPGILVQLVTLVGTLMAALNIVREKEAGTLDQLNVTPVSRGAFIVAKLLPMWAIAMVTLAVGLAIGRLGFGMPMVGSIPLVFLSAGIYLVPALGIGLWISTVADTQQQAVLVTFALTMVYTLMSGLFTPITSMPHWAQLLAQFNPLVHFIEVIRAVLLKGATFSDVLRQLVILAVAGLVIVTIAVRRYRKRSA